MKDDRHLLLLTPTELLAVADVLPGNVEVQRRAAEVRQAAQLREALRQHLDGQPPHIVQVVLEVIRVLEKVRRWAGCGGSLGQGWGLISQCEFCGDKGPAKKRKTARQGWAPGYELVHAGVYSVDLAGVKMCGSCQRTAGPIVLAIADQMDVEIGAQLGGKPQRVLLRQWRRCPSCAGLAHEGQLKSSDERQTVMGAGNVGRCPHCGWDPWPMAEKRRWEMLPTWAVLEPLPCPGWGWDKGHDCCGCGYSQFQPGAHLRNVGEQLEGVGRGVA